MKEEWLFPNAIIPVNVETTQALVVEIKRLIDVVGGMALECPNCEWHKDRAARWRDEAYKQAGYPLPEREWVGLTDKEIEAIWKIAMFTDYGVGAELSNQPFVHYARAIEAKLKEKNT